MHSQNHSQRERTKRETTPLLVRCGNRANLPIFYLKENNHELYLNHSQHFPMILMMLAVSSA